MWGPLSEIDRSNLVACSLSFPTRELSPSIFDQLHRGGGGGGTTDRLEQHGLQVLSKPSDAKQVIQIPSSRSHFLSRNQFYLSTHVPGRVIAVCCGQYYVLWLGFIESIAKL